MATQYLDLINFYNERNEVILSLLRDDCESEHDGFWSTPRAAHEWLTGDQGIKVTRVERKLTACHFNAQFGMTYLPDGSFVSDGSYGDPDGPLSDKIWDNAPL